MNAFSNVAETTTSDTLKEDIVRKSFEMRIRRIDQESVLLKRKPDGSYENSKVQSLWEEHRKSPAVQCGFLGAHP